MRTIFNAMVLFIYFLAAAPVATAEQQPTAEERHQAEQYLHERNKQNFIGWKGILFYCSIDQSNRALNEICERTYTNVDFLAASAKINLVKAKSASALSFLAIVDENLVLEVVLTATSAGRPSAIHANLRAYKSYSKAVDTNFLEIDEKSPLAEPRSGELIMWERSIIGASSGATQELVKAVSDGIEQHIKQFFADFLNAKR